MRFQLQVSMIRPSVVRQVQPYLERISRPPWRLNLREDHMVNETMGFLFKCWKLLQAPRWCASGRTGRPKAWMSSRWFSKFIKLAEFFWGAESDVNRLLYECIFCYMTMHCYISIYYILYTIFTSDNIHMIHITEFNLTFFFHQVVSFAQVQWRYYDLPGRSSLFLRLSRWSNKPFFTPLEGRSRSKRGLFLGMWYGSTQCSHWYIDIWCWNDTTTSNNNPWDTLQNMVDL